MLMGRKDWEFWKASFSDRAQDQLHAVHEMATYCVPAIIIWDTISLVIIGEYDDVRHDLKV